ncbi:MAG: hypothetical protein GY754_13605 [bacterium]|nr:hypothetical protein [bacterium]
MMRKWNNIHILLMIVLLSLAGFSEGAAAETEREVAPGIIITEETEVEAETETETEAAAKKDTGFSVTGKTGLVKGNVVIFPVSPQNDIQINSFVELTEKSITRVFDDMGRFLPVERHRRNRALEMEQGDTTMNKYHKTARFLKVDIYALIAIYRRGQIYFGEIKVVSLTKENKELNRSIIVQSRILANIQYKLVREAALLHENLELKGTVLQRDKNIVVVDIGQWHGIKAGSYETKEGKNIEIVQTGRYRSLARIPASTGIKTFILETVPNTEKTVHSAEESIERNTYSKYGLTHTLLKGNDPERRYLQGMCVVNIGGNVCLPGFGSYLSTSYVGFKLNDADTTAIFLSASMVAAHFTLTEFMTGFKSNFFPWVRDSDKSQNVQNLHIFLWASLPVTFTVSYMDQLAHLFDKTKHLPPFFRSKDEAALLFSLFVPGGGLFYKGYRLFGWSYYAVEMGLAGYGIYNLGTNKALYAFAALGAVKLVELFHAYFVSSSYEFYNFEKREGTSTGFSGVSTGLREFIEDEGIYSVSLSYRF